MSRNSIFVDMNEKIKTEISFGCEKNISDRIPDKGKWEFVYGFDHACYWFFQFFPIDNVAESVNNVILEADGLFDKLKYYELARILKNLGSRVQHYEYCLMDMEF